jgi:hypothetical protein
MVMAGRVVCLSVVLVFLGSSEEATRPCGLRANLSVNMLHGRQAPPNPKFVLHLLDAPKMEGTITNR